MTTVVHKRRGCGSFTSRTTSKCGKPGIYRNSLSTLWRTVTCPACLCYRRPCREKLNEQQIDARMAIYDDIIDHLGLSVYDNKIEEEQGKIIQDQIKRLSEKWFNRVS